MTKYKLTTQQLTTYNGFQWEVGKKVTTNGTGEGELCSPGWLHYYHSPELAVLLNPMHANIIDPILWEVEAEGTHKDDKGLKGGCTEMTLLRQIPLPVSSLEQRIAFGILCAKEVYKEVKWNKWADAWLLGGEIRDRISDARAAAATAHYAADADAVNAAYATAEAAYAAAEAAEAAYAATYDADADAEAAYAAFYAARAAADVSTFSFNLQTLAEKALREY